MSYLEPKEAVIECHTMLKFWVNTAVTPHHRPTLFVIESLVQVQANFYIYLPTFIKELKIGKVAITLAIFIYFRKRSLQYRINYVTSEEIQFVV